MTEVVTETAKRFARLFKVGKVTETLAEVVAKFQVFSAVVCLNVKDFSNAAVLENRNEAAPTKAGESSKCMMVEDTTETLLEYVVLDPQLKIKLEERKKILRRRYTPEEDDIIVNYVIVIMSLSIMRSWSNF